VSFIRVSLFTVVFSLLWFVPQGKVLAVEGYQLEPDSIALLVAPDSHGSDDPDYDAIAPDVVKIVIPRLDNAVQTFESPLIQRRYKGIARGPPLPITI
jgi:hypothetical protein